MHRHRGAKQVLGTHLESLIAFSELEWAEQPVKGIDLAECVRACMRECVRLRACVCLCVFVVCVCMKVRVFGC